MENPFDKTARVTPDRYAEFVAQIDLDRVWLREARVMNHRGPDTPEQAVVSVNPSASWEPWDLGFRALHRYELRFQSTDTLLAELDVVLAADFTSEAEMSEDIFAIFQDVNLPVNTWPYLREFTATTLGRFGWTPVTLPTLKRGVGLHNDAARDPESKRS